ncbi:LRP2-binding protein [Lingula anatina]|uniref:LRP2-binding protein n=1 Tax=Lingula anatina TaxID=7574 RepID=A0A1S3I3V1_LINAN|nr:LRP2-binding protein [Lingula anatina]XP_013392511.2 LRP2-binding protein [Lingula anatina]|eukprot:XP_013392510.2 LRP2-binding protein [Lingula anatina]
MEFRLGIPGEPLPASRDGSMVYSVSTADGEAKENLSSLTEEELTGKVESMLLDKIKNGDKQAVFQLGQLYFEQGVFDKAVNYFERAKEYDFQALYQLGVMYYDGLGCEQDPKIGSGCMLQVATSTAKQAQHLVHVAQYNVGRAFYQGFGLTQSDEEAERWWLLAADDGNPNGSILAQSMLGMFYSRPETLDLKKAYFWHSEACGNGSLESQGALGVMLELGLGCKKDTNASFECFKEAADRGNVYAMGHLVKYYYMRKLYTKAADLAARVAMLDDIYQIAAETTCIPGYIAKGISMACFFYARCLHKGHGVEANEEEAGKYYSKSHDLDPDMCATLQGITTHGKI